MYFKLYIKIICSFLLLVILLSCETKVDIIDEKENITIVYCLINPTDTIQYVRIEKSYTGSENPYDMAKISDSIYYNNASVKLESWNGEYKFNTITLQPYYEVNKDQGIFARNDHLVYYTKEKIQGELISLVIDLPDKNEIIFASTKLIDQPVFRRPREFITNIDLFISDGFEIEFSGGGPYNELGIQIFYTELKKDGTKKEKMAEIMKSHGNNYMSSKFNYILREENFYRPIAMAIEEDSTVLLRKFKKIDLVAYSANDVFLEFQNLFYSMNDFILNPASNIINGHGLFANRSINKKEDFLLTRISLDSLVNGRYTGHLKFYQ
ncbi:hypothetical protein ACFLSI_02675 [Bacteroidota bacterium]